VCEIVNFRHYRSIDGLNQAFGDRWLYIGRQNRLVPSASSGQALSESEGAAGLPQSPLANPFRVRGHDRGRTIPHYRRWLWERIQSGDQAVLEALQAIDEASILVCWCKPGPCHGDVVKAAAAWLQSQDKSA